MLYPFSPNSQLFPQAVMSPGPSKIYHISPEILVNPKAISPCQGLERPLGKPQTRAPYQSSSV